MKDKGRNKRKVKLTKLVVDMYNTVLIFFAILAFSTSAFSQSKLSFDVDKELKICADKASQTLRQIPRDTAFPRRMNLGDSVWTYVDKADWTSGFWPGILWYLYESSGDSKWKDEADRFSRYLVSLSEESAKDHDLGFQIYCSFGNGYRLTKDPFYKAVIMRTSDTLATLYNPRVGTILSWPSMVKSMGPHITIIDNMMNLEMLMYAGKTEKSKRYLYDLSRRHADVTMMNHFRNDYTSYHAVIYDLDGKKKKGRTVQGYSDESLWARGQAWAIYGYMLMYRETGQKKYKIFLDKVIKAYLDRLPEDAVPFWDFDDPKIPNAPKDASAASVTASAFLQYAQLLKGKEKQFHQDWAVRMLNSLVANYKSPSNVPAFLLHSTGSKTNEIDVSLIYADYYFIEALVKLKNIH